jgi:branched-subunit amino acid transport protein
MKPTSVEIWSVIVLLMVLVLFLRCGFLVLPRRWQPKGAIAEALGYAPLAALVAICAPEIAKFQLDNLDKGLNFSGMVASLTNDWRLWGALALMVTVVLTKASKRAALYGLSAAALAVWWL